MSPSPVSPSRGRCPFKNPPCTRQNPNTTSGFFNHAPSPSTNGLPSLREARALRRSLLAVVGGVGVSGLGHAPARRGRHGAGGAAEALPGGHRGVRGAALGVPGPPGAVPVLVPAGPGVSPHQRAQRHVPGHLQQGWEALGADGAAEGLRAGRIPLLHQLPEQEGQGAGFQSLRFPGFLLGAALPPGADRGLGEAAAGGGIRALLPLPAQGQPDRGSGQQAELRHPRPRVPEEEERGAGGALPGHDGAPAGILGRVHRGAGGCGVLAGSDQPAARPDRVPAPAGPRGAARGHDPPWPRPLGLRALGPLSPAREPPQIRLQLVPVVN